MLDISDHIGVVPGRGSAPGLRSEKRADSVMDEYKREME